MGPRQVSDAATVAAERTKAWQLLPFFMLRAGGVSANVVKPLRFPELVDWSRRVLRAEHDLESGKEAVTDTVGDAVNGTQDVALRRHLLDVRRDIFNLRLPKQGTLHSAEAALEPEALAKVTRWVAQRRDLQDLLGEGQRVFDDEVELRRAYLKDLATDDVLRDGIVLASPSLDGHLDKYLRAEPGPLNKRLRKIERSLLEYVFRTACKTSPFSTFTPVALGQFDEDADSLLQVDFDRAVPHSHTRLNVATLGRLMASITTDTELRADLPVQVSGGWRLDAQRVRYLRRSHKPGDDDTAMNLDQVDEELFFLSAGPVLDEVLTAVGGDGSSLRYGDLRDVLHRADPESRELADVETFLGYLLHLGFLTVPTFHLDIHAADPTDVFAEKLRGLDRVWAKKLATRLDGVTNLVGKYSAADRPERRRLLGELRSEMTEAQTELGLSEVRVPKGLVYEDVTLDGAHVSANAAQWQQKILDPLQSLSSALPALDNTLPDRLVTRGYFLARYGRGGRCDDLLEFVHDFQVDCYEQFQMLNMRRRPFDDDGGYTPLENWFRQSEITALDQARIELADQMRAMWVSSSADQEELVLDDNIFDRVAARLPSTFGDLDPRSFFLQLTNRGDEPLAVINRSYSGLSLMFSRFAHCFPDSAGYELRDGVERFLRELAPTDTVLAELVGGHDTTNLNLHPSVTEYELVCPGDASSRPLAEQIKIEDLCIVHDDDSDQVRLWSGELERYVVPVYLGFLLPMMLSDLQRILLNFAYTPMASLDLWEGVPEPEASAEVTFRPRIRFSNVVIQRRTWTVPVTAIPRQHSARSDAEWFLNWRRFAGRHGLPDRVFATRSMPTAEEFEGGQADAIPEFKPQYVDLESHLSLVVFDGMLKSGQGSVTFTEMLPDEDGLWLHHGSDGYVSELIVEIDGSTRSVREGGATMIPNAAWTG